MSDSPQSPETKSKDSFQVPVRKSPLFLFAILQIPIVIFMVIMLYLLYQARFS